MPLEFEWDSRKAKRNRQKHGVSFEEASAVFSDPLSVTIDDPIHSDDEDRFIILGGVEPTPANRRVIHRTRNQNSHYQCAYSNAPRKERL